MRYLENDLRLEVTAAELFLHVNTVRYRLRRFEELTGTSMRSVHDLVEIWWAVERARLTRAL
jgi:DNA-binding PucR family transcriptional regulator